jgi:hypothetical protein
MFHSILFPFADQNDWHCQKKQPDCFHDLGLDSLFSQQEHADWFFSSLPDPASILYRQKILQDLESDTARTVFSRFSDDIKSISPVMYSIRKIFGKLQPKERNLLAEGRMLEQAGQYCQAITRLNDNILRISLRSKGLCAFADYVSAYIDTSGFISLTTRIRKLQTAFSDIQYCMFIKDGTIRVRPYEQQQDLARRVLKLFVRFRQGDVSDYRKEFREEPYAEHVEEAVLHLLSAAYRSPFSDLHDFCTVYESFEDPILVRFAEELKFYLFWLNLTAPMKQNGLPFCYPELTETEDSEYCNDSFDIALAEKQGAGIVTNSVSLTPPERIIAVTGPNQGGKTTFARMFGQIHWIMSIGLTVPGSGARLKLFDRIFTHFEQQETTDLENGKLQDDLIRLYPILHTATQKSIVIINEIFASTTVTDAVTLGKLMMDALATVGARTVVVTFLDELAMHGPETVSMMSTVIPGDVTKRTFRILRKPPDGLAYALQLAEKYGLTYQQLCRRLEAQ